MNTMPGMVLKMDRMGSTTPDSLGRRDSRTPRTTPSAKPMATEARVKNRCSASLTGRSWMLMRPHPQSCSAMAEAMLVLVMMPATCPWPSSTTR